MPSWESFYGWMIPVFESVNCIALAQTGRARLSANGQRYGRTQIGIVTEPQHIHWKKKSSYNSSHYKVIAHFSSSFISWGKIFVLQKAWNYLVVRGVRLSGIRAAGANLVITLTSASEVDLSGRNDAVYQSYQWQSMRSIELYFQRNHEHHHCIKPQARRWHQLLWYTSILQNLLWGRNEGTSLSFQTRLQRCVGNAPNIHLAAAVAYSASLFTDRKWQDNCGGWHGAEQMLAFHLGKWQFMRNNAGSGWRWVVVVGGTSSGEGLPPLAQNSLLIQSKDCVKGERYCQRIYTQVSFIKQNVSSCHIICPKTAPPPPSSSPHLKMTGSRTAHGCC